MPAQLAASKDTDLILPIPGAGNPATMLDFRRRVWECNVCQALGNWGSGWAYYGRIDEPDLVVCSDDCRARAIRDGNWPAGE